MVRTVDATTSKCLTIKAYYRILQTDSNVLSKILVQITVELPSSFIAAKLVEASDQS